QIRFTKTWVSLPRSPLTPSLLPDTLKSGQGDPPIIPKRDGLSDPKAISQISLAFKFVILVRAATLTSPPKSPRLFLKLDRPASYISANAGFISFVQTTSKPACSKPISKKPPPVKKESNGICIVYNSLNLK